MSSKILFDIGNRIKERRLELGITQRQAADILDISLNFHGEIERGNKRISLKKILLAYPVFQYGETDWQFLERIASKSHQVLISDSGSNQPSVYVGEESGTAYDLQCFAYEYDISDSFY